MICLCQRLFDFLKDESVQFCELFSNGSLPHRRSQIERLWENSAFENVGKIKPWFGGTWNEISQEYHSDYDDFIIKNVTGRHGFNSSVRRTRQDIKSLLIIEFNSILLYLLRRE